MSGSGAACVRVYVARAMRVRGNVHIGEIGDVGDVGVRLRRRFRYGSIPRFRLDECARVAPRRRRAVPPSSPARAWRQSATHQTPGKIFHESPESYRSYNKNGTILRTKHDDVSKGSGIFFFFFTYMVSPRKKPWTSDA